MAEDIGKYWNLGWKALTVGGLLLVVQSRAYAQSKIIPDNSLGSEASVVNSAPEDLPRELITGGAQRGQNLFHSFQEFNVAEGREAYFVSPHGEIANIFSRITGNNVSEIFGTLGTLGASQPDLFLINPNGIIFGENASLNLGGSLVATTANSIQFGEQGFFATEPSETPPLLTVQPSAFLVNQLNSGTIANNSVTSAGTDATGNSTFVGLRVPDGESLSFLGSEVALAGGGMVALDGQINIAAIKSGRIELNPDLSFNIETISPLGGNVSLTNGAGLITSGNMGGQIAIAAGNISLAGDSRITTGILGNLGSPQTQAQNIELIATENIAINNSFVFNRIETEATGNSGDLLIDTANLSITNGGQAGSLTFGTGDTGNVIVNVNETISLDSQDSGLLTGIFAQTLGSAVGNVGNIEITTQNLNLNNARIDTNTFARGNAGNLSITAKSISLTNGGALNTSTIGQGDAGDLSILADDLTIDGGIDNIFTAVSASVGEGAVGRGGTLELGTEQLPLTRLTVTNGGQILSSVFGDGDGGSINIRASERVLISNEGTRVRADIAISAEEGSQGGNLTINTPRLVIADGAQVSTSTFGQGNAGNLIINATESVKLVGEDGQEGANGQVLPGGLFAQVEPTGEGQGGNLTINTPQLTIRDGSKLQVATFGRGDAGELMIAAKQIDIYNTPVFSDFTTGIFASVAVDRFRTTEPPDGNGGNVNIFTEQLRVWDGGKISVTTEGIGDAGTLNITATESIEVTGVDPEAGDGVSLIGADVTESGTGKGGDINLITGNLTISDRAEVSVSSLGSGEGGDIRIRGNDLSLNNNALLNAQTFTTDGGNIDLAITDLITLNNQSQISATAGTASAGGDGGNINIDTAFVVAFPNGNNDITANAFAGTGGKINIKAESLFGIAARSATPPNDTNDIDASSQFGLDGDISIETPDIDPTRGLDNLPVTLVDVSSLITRNCLGSGDEQLNEFVITGRGGLPQNPRESLGGEATLVPEWISFPEAKSSTESSTPDVTSTQPQSIVEAKAWKVKPDGTVVLFSESERSNLTIPRLGYQSCDR